MLYEPNTFEWTFFLLSRFEYKVNIYFKKKLTAHNFKTGSFLNRNKAPSVELYMYLIGYIDLRRLTQYDVINLQGLEVLFPFLLQSNYIGERPPDQEYHILPCTGDVCAIKHTLLEHPAEDHELMLYHLHSTFP